MNLRVPVLVLCLLASLTAQQSDAPKTPRAGPLGEIVAAVLAEGRAPALGGAIFRRDGTIEVGVAGVRAAGGTDPVRLDDAWHLGSCTKAMTAMLAATMVEQERIAWDTTIAEVFTGEDDVVHETLRSVTLGELLRHRSGLAANFPRKVTLEEIAKRPKTITREQRRERVLAVLAAAGPHPPRSRELYSNLGFTVAAAMLEERAQTGWRTLLQQQVFAPRGVKHFGFGPPEASGEGASGAIRGHRRSLFGRGWNPVLPGPAADNPPLMGPAGRVAMSLEDWAKVLLPWTNPAAEAPGFPSPATRRTMLKPLGEGGRFGAGWVTVERPWAGGTALTHSGSNTMWHVVAWIAPEKGFGILAATNVADREGPARTDALAARLIRHATR